MAEKDIKEQAGQLQQVYLKNLDLKLREGKSLTEREFEHLRLLSADIITHPSPSENPPSKQRADEPQDDTDEVGVPERLRFKRSFIVQLVKREIISSL
jgi:hypothetical protein